jgi:hypothetical protein
LSSISILVSKSKTFGGSGLKLSLDFWEALAFPLGFTSFFPLPLSGEKTILRPSPETGVHVGVALAGGSVVTVPVCNGI